MEFPGWIPWREADSAGSAMPADSRLAIADATLPLLARKGRVRTTVGALDRWVAGAAMREGDRAKTGRCRLATAALVTVVLRWGMAWAVALAAAAGVAVLEASDVV